MRPYLSRCASLSISDELADELLVSEAHYDTRESETSASVLAIWRVVAPGLLQDLLNFATGSPFLNAMTVGRDEIEYFAAIWSSSSVSTVTRSSVASSDLATLRSRAADSGVSMGPAMIMEVGMSHLSRIGASTDKMSVRVRGRRHQSARA
jgi:hypothetical protein